METLTAKNATDGNLYSKLEKLYAMKWILNLEDKEDNFSVEQLQENMDEIIGKNFMNLTMLYYFFQQIPSVMLERIEEINALTNDELAYKRRFKAFKNSFETNKEFRDFEQYLLLHIAREATFGLNKNELKNVKLLENLVLETKQKYYILLFNILFENCNGIVKFNLDELVYNLPLLVHWISENKNKPIENLSNDDCEIIAGLMYGLSYDEMLTLNLSSFAKDYRAINRIIENLPKKFHVNNITQMLFKLLLQNPFLWSKPTHETIVEAIKGIHNVL